MRSEIRVLRALAASLHKQADQRRERAINAAGERINDEEEVNRWRVAFSTSYQTLRGMAVAHEEAADQLQAEQDAMDAPLRKPGK